MSFIDRPRGCSARKASGWPSSKKVDAEAIGTWVLDVYLKARIAGATDAEARQTIADNIKGSDEWRRKHQTQLRLSEVLRF